MQSLFSGESLTAFRVFTDDGTFYETNMAEGVTLADAKEHFIGMRIESFDELSFRTVVSVEEIAPLAIA